MSASVIAALPAGLERTRYVRHDLHSAERLWTEKNCYIDIWIELVHALGLDPYAMLAFTVAVDFEGDQWTFFKPPHADLQRLYGLDVQELYVWRPLLDHALEHLRAGKLISTEADAFWLPDTAGSDYRSTHTKTTIVLERIDVEAQQLGYFHNAGYFTLAGEDFAQLFRLNAPADPAFMPLFAEIVRCDRAIVLDPRALRDRSRELLRRHIEWRPRVNPMPEFRERFEEDLPELSRQGMGAYHAWVFGTLRQLGAASELAALYLLWLDGVPETATTAAARPLLELSSACKSLVLKVARAVNSRRPLDASASFEQLSSTWELADRALRELP
jgi:hypothetical protein